MLKRSNVQHWHLALHRAVMHVERCELNFVNNRVQNAVNNFNFIVLLQR